MTYYFTLVAYFVNYMKIKISPYFVHIIQQCVMCLHILISRPFVSISCLCIRINFMHR
jgi:hypothetical protein